MNPGRADGADGRSRSSGSPMDAPRCTATSKQTGERCKRRPHPGLNVCVAHGAGTKRSREAAARRRADNAATALVETLWVQDPTPITSPVEALQRMAGQLEHSVNVLGARVDAQGLDGVTATAWLRVLAEQRKLLTEMERLGLQQKVVHLREQDGQLLASVVRVILSRLMLTEEQVGLAASVVPAVFRAAAAGELSAVAAEVVEV